MCYSKYLWFMYACSERALACRMEGCSVLPVLSTQPILVRPASARSSSYMYHQQSSHVPEADTVNGLSAMVQTLYHSIVISH